MAHDLSAGEAKLDLALLTRTAQIAVRYAKDQLHRDLGKWYEPTLVSPVYAKSMAETAQALAVATETLYVLVESASRHITIVNQPTISI